MGERQVPYAELISVLDVLPVLIRETRRRLGHSYREAGEKAGVSFNTVRRLEQGLGGVQADQLRKLLEYVS